MSDAISLVALTPNDLDAYLASASERARRWVASQSFKALPLTHCLVPNDDGGLAQPVVAVVPAADFFAVQPWQLGGEDGVHIFIGVPAQGAVTGIQRDVFEVVQTREQTNFAELAHPGDENELQVLVHVFEH